MTSGGVAVGPPGRPANRRTLIKIDNACFGPCSVHLHLGRHFDVENDQPTASAAIPCTISASLCIIYIGPSCN